MSEVIRCHSCGQANRVGDLGAGQKAVCGRCHAPLDGSTSAKPIVLTDATFREAISDGRATVVDFWAPWCGPCRMLAPILEELAAARTDVRFAKLNVDENGVTASRFGVQGIPLLVFFKGGEERGRLVGAVPRSHIEQAIQQHLGGS